MAKIPSTSFDYLIRLKNLTTTYQIKATNHSIDAESGFVHFAGMDGELLIVAIAEIASINRKYPTENVQ